MVRVVSVSLRLSNLPQVCFVFIQRSSSASASPSGNSEKFVPPLRTFRIRFPALTYTGRNQPELVTLLWLWCHPLKRNFDGAKFWFCHFSRIRFDSTNRTIT